MLFLKVYMVTTILEYFDRLYCNYNKHVHPVTMDVSNMVRW